MEINPLRIPVTSMAGLAAIIIFLALAVASTLQYPGPSLIYTMWLDDPGNTNLNPYGAAYFRTACILSGILLTIFYTGLIRWYEDDTVQKLLLAAGQLSGIVSGAALLMAGIRPALYGPEHYMWSTIFLTTTALALLLISAALLGHLYYGKFVLLTGILAMTLGMLAVILKFVSIDLGIADLLAVMLAFAWIGAFSWNTYSRFAGEEMALAA